MKDRHGNDLMLRDIVIFRHSVYLDLLEGEISTFHKWAGREYAMIVYCIPGTRELTSHSSFSEHIAKKP